MYDSDPRPPQDVLADLERQARRYETPTGAGAMAWRVWGSGPPVLLLHGAQGSWAHWVRNIAELARRRQVIAPDLPGYGESDPPPRLTTAWEMGEPVARGLRALGFETPLDVAGFSLGGVVGGHIAAEAPDLVRRLVIIGSGGFGTPLGRTDMRRLAGLASDEARLAARRNNLLQLMLHAESSADAMALHIQGRRAKHRGAAPVGGMVMPDRLLAVLPRIGAQVDLFWGEFDRPHPDPEQHVEILRRTHPDATLHVMRGAGHWAMYEAATQFNAELQALLDQPPRRS